MLLTCSWPFSLPDRLYLRRQITQPRESHAVQIGNETGNKPLFVGYRDGSHVRNRVKLLNLCLGNTWYGNYGVDTFIEAKVSSSDSQAITINIRTGKGTRVFRAIRTRKGTWNLQIEVLDQATQKVMPEFFEWRHQRNFKLKGNVNQQQGSILVQLSTNQAVARIQPGSDKAGSAMAQELEIDYLGAGQNFGWLWKIVVFVIGILGA